MLKFSRNDASLYLKKLHRLDSRRRAPAAGLGDFSVGATLAFCRLRITFSSLAMFYRNVASLRVRSSFCRKMAQKKFTNLAPICFLTSVGTIFVGNNFSEPLFGNMTFRHRVPILSGFISVEHSKARKCHL